MSGEPPFSPDPPTDDPAGPFSKLIADAIAARRLKLRGAAELVTDAAWELGRSRDTVHPSTIHGWIHGAVAGPKMRRWIARGLDIPLEDLNAAADEQWHMRRSRHSRPESPPVPLPDPDSHSADDRVDSDDVKRRTFGLWLATAGAAVATMDLDRAAALMAGTQPDHAALDDMETLTRDLVQREATLAARSLFPAVQGHLQGMRDMLLWTPASLAPRAYSLAGQTALLAGYLMLQQERTREADAYWELAARFADMSGDVRLSAALLVHQAWRWEEQDLTRSLAFLDRALSILGQNPDPAMAAMVLSARAARHAEATETDPNHATSALRDIDSAQANLSRTPTAHDRLYLFRSVSYQAIESRADVFRNLGSHGDAATAYQAALALIDPTWQASRSWVTSGLAAAIARRGDPEYACDLFATSIQLAANVSPRSARYIQDKYMTSLAGYDGPAARRLNDRIRALALPGGRLTDT
jgi:tetratricopeptide (TPR) repeat protein